MDASASASAPAQIAGTDGTTQTDVRDAITTARSVRRPSNAIGPKPKRAKYTAAACDECKRRKLKCVQSPDGRQCDRCKAGQVVCSLNVGRSDTANTRPPAAVAVPPDDGSRIDRLEQELAALRRQVVHLATMADKGHTPRSELQHTDHARTPSQASVTAAGVKERKEVQFVGTTRPAFALNVAKATLSVVDEPSDDSSSEVDGPVVSSMESPETETAPTSTTDPLLGMPFSQVFQLLDLFQDEVEPIYPLLDTSNLRSRASGMIKQFKEEYHLKFDGRISQKNIHLLKIVLATALVLENQGKLELSTQLIESFEDDALRITSPSDVDLQEAQIFAIMSIYHFHCDEELLAYRSIGISTRMVLELGLHRRRSLEENYPDPSHRSLANRAFWCIYVLDRRWSFGTGLSFALIDRDIDPQLPDPSPHLPYFSCLVAYGKLCSKVWDAIPHYGSSHEVMLPSVESALENDIQRWFSTIPEDTHLTNASDTMTHDPEFFQHLQTLLYLRGNYIRCLIHRHHVVTPAAIARNHVNAHLVVSIAQDTIQILVNLNNTGEVYSRHQVAYNYFLISAISILLLAVCHAPAEFAQSCRQAFFAAINLVRGFSRLTLQGRRLWSSIRGLVTRLKRVGIMNDTSSTGRQLKSHIAPRLHRSKLRTDSFVTDQSSRSLLTAEETATDTAAGANGGRPGIESANFQTFTPDMDLMGDDLLGVFDTFGGAYVENDGHQSASMAHTQLDDNLSFLNRDIDDFSEYFIRLM